jgi:hypothetical protein
MEQPIMMVPLLTLVFLAIFVKFLSAPSVGIPGILVLVVTTYYVKYIFKMLTNKDARKGVAENNRRLDELRCIPVKTVEQQKEFISLKYGSGGGKWKFTWIWFNKLLLTIAIYIVIFRTFKYILFISNISISLAWAVVFIILFPLGMNYILGKAGLQKSDLSVLLRGGKKQ